MSKDFLGPVNVRQLQPSIGLAARTVEGPRTGSSSSRSFSRSLSGDRKIGGSRNQVEEMHPTENTVAKACLKMIANKPLGEMWVVNKTGDVFNSGIPKLFLH